MSALNMKKHRAKMQNPIKGMSIDQPNMPWFLPSSDLKKGQMYNVVAANDKIPAGTNYVWNGESWDPMVGQIDLTPFLTSTDAANTYVALNASATNAGSDIVRLLGVNSQGKAISITPKAIVEYVIKTLMDDDLLAV